MVNKIEYGVFIYDRGGVCFSFAHPDYETARQQYIKEVRRCNFGTGLVVEFSVGQWSTKNWQHGQYDYRPLFRFEAPDYWSEQREGDY